MMVFFPGDVATDASHWYLSAGDVATDASHWYLVATLKTQPVVMVASFKANARPRSQDQEHSLLKVLACTFGLGEREL